VAWSRSWEDGVELPGVGIEFDPATIGEAFREFIVRGPQLSELIAEP
jgi:hypothetical protein